MTVRSSTTSSWLSTPHRPAPTAGSAHRHPAAPRTIRPSTPPHGNTPPPPHRTRHTRKHHLPPPETPIRGRFSRHASPGRPEERPITARSAKSVTRQRPQRRPQPAPALITRQRSGFTICVPSPERHRQATTNATRQISGEQAVPTGMLTGSPPPGDYLIAVIRR
jgi:hypothetical protein